MASSRTKLAPWQRSGLTTTVRTKRVLEHLGYRVGKCELWNRPSPGAVRQDLFGFIDQMAIRPNRILAVQATTGDNLAARVAKILQLGATVDWLLAGGHLQAWGWRKLASTGRWEPRIEQIYLPGPLTSPETRLLAETASDILRSEAAL